jgi:hypothetical protein
VKDFCTKSASPILKEQPPLTHPREPALPDTVFASFKNDGWGVPVHKKAPQTDTLASI